MYYISSIKTGAGFAQMKKRLRDFKGQQGEQYLVRTKAHIDRYESVPVYDYTDGALKKTKTFAILRVLG